MKPVRLYAAIFIVALAVRLLAIEISGANRVVFGDGPDYIAFARSLCSEHLYPDRGSLQFFRPPGLPFFIAGVTFCHPSAVPVIKLGLAVCDALTCTLIASIALLLFGRTAAWLAGLGACCHPVFVAGVCDVRSEPLFMTLLTLAILLMLKRREKWAGVALSLAALTRPSALLCIPLFALFRPRRAVALVVSAAVTLVPWAARNFIRYHEIILVTDAGGFSFWRGSHPETIALAGETDSTTYRALALHFETVTIAETARQVDAVATTPAARSREWLRRGLANIARQPRAEAVFVARKAWLYWRPWLSAMEYSPRVVEASALFFIPFYLLAAIGIARCGDRRLALTVVVFLAVMWLGHLPYQISMRLRIPFTDPLLIVFAASNLERFRDHRAE